MGQKQVRVMFRQTKEKIFWGAAKSCGRSVYIDGSAPRESRSSMAFLVAGPHDLGVGTSLHSKESPWITAEFEMRWLKQILPDKRQFETFGETPAKSCIHGGIAFYKLAGQCTHVAIGGVKLKPLR